MNMKNIWKKFKLGLYYIICGTEWLVKSLVRGITFLAKQIDAFGTGVAEAIVGACGAVFLLSLLCLPVLLAAALLKWIF